MRIFHLTKFEYFAVLLLTILLVPGNVLSAAQKTVSWLDQPVTIRFQNEKLNKVLEKISKQTGIAILYDQELADEKVTGSYKNVKASDAITRLFGSKNKSIQVDQGKKVFIVKTFGSKSFIWAGVDKQQSNSSGITLADLKKLHAQQYKEYKERISNDNEVLEGGMTRAELRSMQEKQQQQYQARMADDNEVLEGGMTRAELRSMQEKQQQQYQARMADDNEVLEGGMTRVELKSMQEKQQQQYQARMADDNEVLEGGMTRAELRSMQKKQHKQYLKRQNDPLRIVQ